MLGEMRIQQMSFLFGLNQPGDKEIFAMCAWADYSKHVTSVLCHSLYGAGLHTYITCFIYLLPRNRISSISRCRYKNRLVEMRL